MSEPTPPLSDVVESWPVVSSTDLFRDDWVMALRADVITRPGGAESFRRLVLEHPGAVVVLAVDEHERVLCLWQYRHPAGRRFVELPAGLLDHDGEEPLEVAVRELREEAGLEATQWTPLLSTYSSPGISDEVMHFFLARGITEVTDRGFELQHEEADMTTAWVPFQELYEAALAGRVGDAPLVLAILVAQARGLAGAIPTDQAG